MRVVRWLLSTRKRRELKWNVIDAECEYGWALVRAEEYKIAAARDRLIEARNNYEDVCWANITGDK